MTNVHGTQVTGGSFPARIFGRFMRDALAGVPVQNLHVASPDDLPLRGGPRPAELGAEPPPVRRHGDDGRSRVLAPTTRRPSTPSTTRWPTWSPPPTAPRPPAAVTTTTTTPLWPVPPPTTAPPPTVSPPTTTRVT